MAIIMSSTSSDDDLVIVEQQSGSPSGNARGTLASHSRGEGIKVPIVVGIGEGVGVTSNAATTASAAGPSSASVVPLPNLVNGLSTLVAVTEEELEGQQTSSVREENGQPVVGIWIVPTVIGVLSCLIQVVEGSQKANSDEKLLLYLCSSISLTTALLGIVLHILPTLQWINSPRRDFIIRSMSLVALGFTFVDICVLIIFLFIVEQSKACE